MKKSKKRKRLNKKTSFSLKKDYVGCINFLKDSRYFIWVSALSFLIIALLVFLGLQSQELNSLITEQLEKVVLEFEGLNTFQTILKIFINNVIVAFLGIFLGIFLGVAPILMILTNSYVAGFVMSKSVQQKGFLVLWRLLPHGIFELPAAIISFALGIRLGFSIFAKNSSKELKNSFFNSLKTFLLIIIPLLFLASIIEGLLVVFLP